MVTSTGRRRSRLAAPIPPKPAPTTTTRGRCDACTPSSYGGARCCHGEVLTMRQFARLVAALMAATLLAPLPALAKTGGAPKLRCTGDPTTTHRLDVGSTYGFYAL